MGATAGCRENQVPLQEVNVHELLESRGDSGHCGNYNKRAVAVAVIILNLIITIIAQTVHLFTSSSADPVSCSVPAPDCSTRCCLEGWVRYGGKCYYFSEETKNWDSSQHFCSSFNASLAGIDTPQEKDFMMRYAGLVEHWIGLRRESGQPWKWVNGTQLNQPLFEVRAEGDCAYLSDVFVSSSRCPSVRNWICSKPDTYAKAKS